MFCVAPKEYSMLTDQVPLSPSANHGKITQIMFETNIPAM